MYDGLYPYFEASSASMVGFGGVHVMCAPAAAAKSKGILATGEMGSVVAGSQIDMFTMIEEVR